MQKTLIICKPDCVQRRLVGSILQRFEAKGLRVAALKLIQVDRPLAEKHYAEHKERPFFPGLIEFITGGPVVVGVLEGNEAVAVVRNLLGATSGTAAAPGTIRGDFSISKQNNLVHGSDSPESAEREIALWFQPGEVVDYAVDGSRWVFDGAEPMPPAERSQKKLFPNPFYVLLLASSTLFVVTTLAYLIGPTVATEAATAGAGAKSPPPRLADWLDRRGPLALAVEFGVMLVSAVLAMATDRFFPSRPGRPGPSA